MPTDETTRPHTDSISFEFDLPHAPAKVWRALTDPALLSEWIMPVVGFEPAPGATFRFTTEPQPGWDGVVHCRLLSLETERAISWRWVVGDIDTVVAFTLTPTPTGTRLSLVQSGFGPDQRQNVAGARYGWKMMGGKLADLLGRAS